jgi:hypothetical protein
MDSREYRGISYIVRDATISQSPTFISKANRADALRRLKTKRQELLRGGGLKHLGQIQAR